MKILKMHFFLPADTLYPYVPLTRSLPQVHLSLPEFLVARGLSKILGLFYSRLKQTVPDAAKMLSAASIGCSTSLQVAIEFLVGGGSSGA